MNLPTFIIAFIIASALLRIVIHLIRKKKQGGCLCGCCKECGKECETLENKDDLK